MKISVIVPIFNSEKFLKTSLDSLASQKLGSDDIEFLLINDGSVDGSLEIMKSYTSEDDRFKIFDRSNTGYGASLNFGLTQASGNYIGILEPDDWIDSDMYSTMLSVAQRDDLDIVRCNYKKVWTKAGTKTEVIESLPKDLCNKSFRPIESQRCFFFHPAIWSMLVKKSLLVENDIKLLETPGAAFQDTSYSFKLWACAESAICIDEAFVNYRQDNESSSINNPNTSKFVHLEYDEVKRFVSSHQNSEILAPIAMRRAFLAYVWNYERLDRELHLDFAKQANCDMKEWSSSGFFNKDLYLSWEITDLEILLDSPEKFMKFKDSTPRLLRKLKHIGDSLKR